MEKGSMIYSQYGWTNLNPFEHRVNSIKCPSIKCPDCMGSGYVQHPAWSKFFESNPVSVDDETILSWFRENWDGGIKSLKDIPPEEEICDFCGGTGEINLTEIILSKIIEEFLGK